MKSQDEGGDSDSLSSSRSLSRISLHSKDSLDDDIKDDGGDAVSRDSIDDEISDNEVKEDQSDNVKANELEY